MMMVTSVSLRPPHKESCVHVRSSTTLPQKPRSASLTKEKLSRFKKDFGLFVALLNVQGLCHISEMAHARIENIYNHYSEIDVQVLDIHTNGNIRLSRKALLEAPLKNPSLTGAFYFGYGI